MSCSGGAGRLAAAALLFSLASTVAAETLTAAVARSLAQFPEMKRAAARVFTAGAQVGQARAEFLPSVNASIGEGREKSKNLSTRAFGSDPMLTRAEKEVNLSQLVYDGGAAGGQLSRYRARLQGAQYSVSSDAESVALRAAQAYIEVLRLREQLSVARENVATHRKTLADVTLLADAGRGKRADVVQAEARLALAVSTVEQLRGQLQQAEAAYRYFTGAFPDDLAPPQSLTAALPARLEPALDEALAAHPAVQAAQKEFEAAQYDRDSVRARRNAPRVAIEAGATRNRDLDGVRGPNEDKYAMLRLRYNLFRGFGDDARLLEAEGRIDEAIAELARVRNELGRDVHQAWETLAADRARLPQLERYARASADVAEAYRLQFQLGQRTLLDVLNAENERFNARGSMIAGRMAVTSGEIRVLSSLGRLLAALELELPDYERRAEVQP